MVTILVIENNLVDLDLVHRYLKAFDAQLMDARTGNEGIQLAAAEHPDMILMDIDLPDMHGREVLARFRTVPHLAGVPVVALSADDNRVLKKQCLSEGFDDFLTNPVSVTKLLRVVQTLLGINGKRIA